MIVAQAFYKAAFRKQLDGSNLAGENCGAASGAMIVDQGSLGAKKPTASAFRKLTGDFSGGLFIATIGNTIERYGVGVQVWDGNDGLTWTTLLSRLKAGRFAVVNGNYAVVPTRLTGSDTFNGLHSVAYHQYSASRNAILVGDPLCDGRRLPSGRTAPKGWQWWPVSIARAYVESFDRKVAGTGLHAAILDRKRLKARPVSPFTNIRSGPGGSYPIIDKFGGTQTVIWGVTVQGESVAGNRVWYRVWAPNAARVGFCHSSVVSKV